MNRASIIIPSYRGAARVGRLLSALSAQTWTDFEAYVVVDGVIDETPELVAAHGDQRISALVLPTNEGRVAALNAGFARAAGDVLIRCDDDLEPGPGWLAAHVASHDGPPVGAVGFCADVLPPGAYARAYGDPRTERMRALTRSLSGTDRAWQLWGGNVSVSRATWELVGPYDAHFRGYGWEDMEWGFRLHRAGVPIFQVPGAESRHLAGSTNVQARARRAYESGAARRVFEAKHQQGPSCPQASRADKNLWSVAVQRTAHHLTDTGSDRLARYADSMLTRVPTAVGSKVAAFVVETSSVAGYLAASGATGTRPVAGAPAATHPQHQA